MPADHTLALLDQARRGERAALARVLTLVEQGGDDAEVLAGALVGRPAAGHVVGITGPPGVGKSTLSAELVGLVRRQDRRIAVLAVDPSSPRSGGALLGDRIRMQVHATDPGVFIRSMASRGHEGGLALAVPGAVTVLLHAGFDWVLVESVGVGQLEAEIARAADCTVVVVAPDAGDAVQARKAGLLELADVFVVNRADRPGARDTARDLEHMIASRPGSHAWAPPVVLTQATTGDGVEDLLSAVTGHLAHLTATGQLEERRRARRAHQVRLLARRLTEAQLERSWSSADELRAAVDGEALTTRVAATELLRRAAEATLSPADPDASTPRC